MKNIIAITITMFLFGTLKAVEPFAPQKVYSIVKQKQSLSWYETQAGLWVKELEKNDKNQDAWLNYYTAKRMEKILGGNVNQKDLDNLVADMTKVISDTYEGHYITYWNGNNKKGLFGHLEKAYALNPERAETFDDFITYYELNRNKEGVTEFCNKMFESNDISANVYAWNYNMLVSTDEDAILITNGDNDTYPAMVLQQTKEVRKDVSLINLYLLADKEYQNMYFAELGIKAFTTQQKDFDNSDDYFVALCNHINEHTERPIYFAAGISKVIYNTFSNDLYNVGLAFKWTEEKFDNIAVTKRNYEKRFLTDYMKMNLFNDLSASVNNHMNASYLMPLLTLHNHYGEGDEQQNLDDIESLINKIADKSGRTEEVNKVLNPVKVNNVVSKVIDDPRDAYFGFLEVNDTMHVTQREIENEVYDKFLLDLLKQRRYDDLEVAKIEDVDWDLLLNERYKELSYDEIFVHGKPDEAKFPVLNITYEAAVMYCEWLTNIYNNLEHKKKKYKKVEFRLPTEKEWEYLAKSGRDNIVNFPWGDRIVKDYPNRDFDMCVTNIRGCMLSNIDGYSVPLDVSEDATCPASIEEKFASLDGGIFPVKTTSYIPNYFGLYNVIGNVAEMVQEKGVAKGGSWNSSMDEAKIGEKTMYEGSSPEVGFRVVMIVKEK
jgi:formylglycine-generating enzyme required for sulfatase activity